MPAAEIDEAMVALRRAARATCCSPPTSSRRGWTCRAPTRWSSGARTASACRSSTSCAAASGAAAGAGRCCCSPMPEARRSRARTLKRLRTLEAFDRLGAGFAISARDLDMRGAGDLLGEAQAGHMKLIGVDLYQHLLAARCAPRAARTVERWTPELNLGDAGALPEDWMPEAEVRAGALCPARADRRRGAALDAFEDELEDRFGPLARRRRRARSRVARIRMLARGARRADRRRAGGDRADAAQRFRRQFCGIRVGRKEQSTAADRYHDRGRPRRKGPGSARGVGARKAVGA